MFTAYFVGDPGGKDIREQKGQYTADWGDLWMKSLTVTTGQCMLYSIHNYQHSNINHLTIHILCITILYVCMIGPVQRYNRRLLNKILFDNTHFGELVNGKRIDLNDAPLAFKKFAAGEAVKYVFDPHHVLGRPQPLQ